MKKLAGAILAPCIADCATKPPKPGAALITRVGSLPDLIMQHPISATSPQSRIHTPPASFISMLAPGRAGPVCAPARLFRLGHGQSRRSCAQPQPSGRSKKYPAIQRPSTLLPARIS